MNKYQKLVQQEFLNDEEKVIKRLKTVYNKSLDDVTKKSMEFQTQIDSLGAVLNMTEDESAKEVIQSMIQSKIYQKQYQDALGKQIGAILDTMQVEQFTNISDYLTKSYENGFIGTMYDLHGQGIPLIMPLDQTAMVRAVQIDSKISQGLYKRLGEDVDLLKRRIIGQVSRGISSGMSYQQVAQQLAGATNIGYNNAIRIARTEGHRVQVQSTMDAMIAARDKGADVVKQWDATLDKRTRKSHRRVDGEIRELEEYFSNGLLYPSDPSGGASEVINCRCALLQRARWALDEDELETLKERAAYYGLDKTANFEDFKIKYLDAAKEIAKAVPKQYLTQKKLEQNISEADKQIAELEEQKALLSEEKELAKELAEKQAEISKFNISKKYSNIWKEDVTLDDWFDKKDAIAKKKKYFLDKYLATDGAEELKWEKLLLEIDDFNDKGEKYYALKQQIDSIEDKIKKLKKSGLAGLAEVDDKIKALQKQKDEWQKKLDKKLIAVETKKLKKEQEKLKKQLDAFDTDKKYSGIWKDDVTLDDWFNKKDAIAKKKDYFKNKMWAAMQGDEIDKWKDLLDELDDFDKKGAEYYALKQQIDGFDDKIKNLKKNGLAKVATGGKFTPDAYGQRKDDAFDRRFTNKNDADAYYRPLLDKGWNNLTDEEKFAVWQYTHNSHPINRPLSGYDRQWGIRSNYKGLDGVGWDNESGTNYDAILHSREFIDKFGNAKSADYGGSIRKYSDVIAELTTAIDKSEFEDDMWLVRGSVTDAFAGLLDGDIISYGEAERLINSGNVEELKKIVLGNTFQTHSFTSTAIADGTGFGGNISYRIYAPKGTKGIYAEPQSYFGSTINGEEIYSAGQSYYRVGGEAEIIIQRGTKYRITDIKSKGYGDIEVIMEIVDQPDYFQTGFEHTFDGGLTKER